MIDVHMIRFTGQKALCWVTPDIHRLIYIAVFKTNGCPVAPGDQKLGWTSNSLAPGRFDYSLKLVNFKLISMVNILNVFCEIAIRSMPQYLTDH